MIMFFLKNDTSAIKEETIRKTIFDKEGKALLHINITYPAFTLRDRNRLKQNAQPFYERSAKKFQHFAETELLERAKNMAEQEVFRPLGAVMKFNRALENKSILSIYTDISVFDGKEQNQMRSSQVWNKSKGFIYSFSDVFMSGAKEYMLSRFHSEGYSSNLSPDEYKKRLKRFFADTNFYLTEKSVAFFYPSERIGGKHGVKVFYIGLNELMNENLLKMSL